MSQTEPEHSEFADKVSSNSGGWPAKERHRSLKRSDSAKGRRSQGGAVDDASSQQILSAREKIEAVALGKNEGENASLISRVTIGAEPDVAFSSTGVDTRCGILWIRPAALQRFCKPRFMLANMCAISFMHSFLTSGSINAVLPSLERRFQLRSFESAMIISAYNVANCIAIAPVAFMGTSRNKPVFIGVGVLTVGVGALLFSSVHFIAPAYQWGSEHQDLCPAGQLPDEFCLRGDVRNYRFLLMLANAMHGIGSTPFYTLGVSYMDESVPTRTVSTYLGVFSCMGVMGLGFGFMASGFFLRFYVDVTRDVKHLGLTSGSAVWVGAWWIGFLLSGLVMLVISLSSMLFPKHMPSYYSLIEEKNTESHLGEHVMKDASLRQLPGAIYGILSNSTFLSLALAGTADYMMTNAVAQISTKFFESQFAMSSSKAAAFLDAGAVTGGCGGTILGGHLVTRLNMSCENIIKMCLIVSIVPWVCIFMFRSYCPDPIFAVNIPAMLNGSDHFVFPCNKHCNCHNSVYNPVCSVDGTVFFSRVWLVVKHAWQKEERGCTLTVVA
ncbi:solute carrier organic anion transporter family member 4A1-like [Rhipicephalus microplus]|uniref:solute carrier organic anion transporter family member 4A1-like n=1 Tax=Rhipicephalus microplus TaxID=6941 RepID=UPI003F6C89E1